MEWLSTQYAGMPGVFMYYVCSTQCLSFFFLFFFLSFFLSFFLLFFFFFILLLLQVASDNLYRLDYLLLSRGVPNTSSCCIGSFLPRIQVLDFLAHGLQMGQRRVGIRELNRERSVSCLEYGRHLPRVHGLKLCVVDRRPCSRPYTAVHDRPVF